MKDTLLYLLSQIVDKQEALSIEEVTDVGKNVLVIHADQADIGKIIGKHGRIIRAIRDLIKIMAVKQNAYVDITIAES
jgi:hypothetical protein